MSADIHKTSIVSSKALLDHDVIIGPFCTIGAGVKIKGGTKVISHAVIEGSTEIGENCTIYPFASIGTPPQDLKYKNEKTGVKIGNNNILREYITIHRASVSGYGFTEIGNSNFLMAYTHVAHDCKLGNSIIMANAATLGGHVMVEDGVFIGGLAAVHQFGMIGAYAMIGGLSAVTQDVLPYTMVSGSKPKLYGLNAVGLKRKGFSDETIKHLKKAYKILFREKRTLKEAIKKIRTDMPQTPEIIHMIDFIERSKRGICR
jgi:UDP-N-acetylglucosamine acyltransferase